MAVKDGDIVEGKSIDLRVDKEYRTIITTFLLLPKSRRVIIAVAAFLISGFVAMVPQLEPFKEYIGQFVTMAILLILGISAEDVVAMASKVWANNKNANIEEEVTSIVTSIINDALGGIAGDEILDPPADSAGAQG